MTGFKLVEVRGPLQKLEKLILLQIHQKQQSHRKGQQRRRSPLQRRDERSQLR